MEETRRSFLTYQILSGSKYLTINDKRYRLINPSKELRILAEHVYQETMDDLKFDSLITNVLRGGGLSIINSSPYLKDLHITGNSARNVGAGIGLINSSAVIESCIIDNNNIPNGDALGGGGIAINGGAPTIFNTQISNNIVGTNIYSLNGGGGILCGFSFGDEPLSLNMYNTTIFSNEANIGGGIGALSGNIYIDRALIAQNIGDYGSAISMGEPLGLVVGDINMDIIISSSYHTDAKTIL